MIQFIYSICVFTKDLANYAFSKENKLDYCAIRINHHDEIIIKRILARIII